MMKKTLTITTLALAAILTVPAGAQKKSNVLDISKSITDNAIVYPESFETDTQALLEGWYMKNYTATDNRYKTDSGPAYTDEIIMERLRNMPTVIDMPYNQVVRTYIDRYAKHGRSLVTACLGLGTYYMPIIEQALEAEGLPNELKYLPMIESAYNPNAVSKAGATGMWQFMIAAAKGYDMEVNSLIDERRDPWESSKKGAKLLKDLYNTYGRWDLAIAAYNCGPGNVNKAIRRAGGDPKSHDFWSIYNYLPAETRGYFPMFVAANYIMNYYPDHGISPVVPTKPLVVDTVGVTRRVNLNQISKVLDIPLDELRLLNPQYRADIIPGSPKKAYMLTLPTRQVQAYIMSEDDIVGYNSQLYAQRTTADPGSAAVPSEPEMVFSDADNALAEENEAEAEQEEEIRRMREQAEANRQQAQQTARTDAPSASSSASDEPTTVRRRRSDRNTADTFDPNASTHKVAAGETIESIAQMYGVSPDNIKIWNGLSRNAVRPGQVLTVKGPSQQRSATPKAPATPATPKATTPAKPRQQQTVAQTPTQQTAQPTAQQKKQKAYNTKSSKTAAQEQAQTQAPATGKKGKKGQQAVAEQPVQTGKNSKAQGRQAANAKQQAQAEQPTGKKGKKGQQAVAEQPKKAAKPAQPATHEVKSGENLERIAKKNGVSVDELRKANKNLKGDMIRPGEKLNIPSKKPETKKADKAAQTEQPTGKKGKKAAAAEPQPTAKKGKKAAAEPQPATKKSKKKK